MSETNQTIEEAPKASPQAKPATRPRVEQLPPYHVVLLDDNDHTYEYVIDMLQSLFSHAQEQALVLAEQVDRTGRAIVCTTHKERAELKRDQILGYGCDFRISRSKQSMKAVIEPAET
jgi:ATP-dependent Clp protease adaptor protein ClpS